MLKEKKLTSLTSAHWKGEKGGWGGKGLGERKTRRWEKITFI